MEYYERYFRSLKPGIWHQIKDIPQNIGFVGFQVAMREQILMPDYKITMGHYCATFRIDKVHIQNNYDGINNQRTA